jgi:hypothetical protein
VINVKRPIRIYWRRVLAVFAVSLSACAVAALPSLLEARRNGNEAAAIGALKSIGLAQALFREADLEQDGELDYGTLKELGDAGLIDQDLADGTRNGYVFEAFASTTVPEFLWYATAKPSEPGVTGDRFFGTTHEGVTFMGTKGPLVIDPETCDSPVRAVSL